MPAFGVLNCQITDIFILEASNIGLRALHKQIEKGHEVKDE